MNIWIQNTDTINDLFAFVTDQNAPPGSPAIPTQRINHGQQQQYLNITPDGNGNCSLNINAQDTNDPSHTKAFPNQSCGDGQTIQIDLF
jgi:hypothetical protein